MLKGRDNAEKIWNYLREKGLSACGTAALMGNLYAESGLVPTALENAAEKRIGYNDTSYTEAVDSGKYKNFVKDAAGYGIAQWSYNVRKLNLLTYCQSKKKSVGDLETQLEFLCKELEKDYNGLYNTLKNTESISTASNSVLMQFERPADCSAKVQVLRATYGKSYYDRYAGSSYGYTIITRGVNEKLSEHFSASEFFCKCGKQHDMKISTALVEKLEKLRKHLKCSKIIVNSGFRCSEWDRHWGGSGSGQHTLGNAADIVCYDSFGKVIPSQVVCCAAQDLEFAGIANIDKTYTAVHVDVRNGEKWFGNEVYGTGSVTKDFYNYFGMTNKTQNTTYNNNSKDNKSVQPAQSYDGKIAGAYKVTASALNMRTGPGTTYPIITTIGNGGTVQNYGYYTGDWYYVEYTKNGQKKIGYVAKDYIKRK